MNTHAVRVVLLSCSKWRPDKGTKHSSRACSLTIALETTSTGAGAFGSFVGLDQGVRRPKHACSFRRLTDPPFRRSSMFRVERRQCPWISFPRPMSKAASPAIPVVSSGNGAFAHQSSPRPLPLLADFFALCRSFIFLRPAASAFCNLSTRSACPAAVSLGTVSRPISRIKECNLRKQVFALSACFRESSAWIIRESDLGAW